MRKCPHFFPYVHLVLLSEMAKKTMVSFIRHNTQMQSAQQVQRVMLEFDWNCFFANLILPFNILAGTTSTAIYAKVRSPSRLDVYIVIYEGNSLTESLISFLFLHCAFKYSQDTVGECFSLNLFSYLRSLGNKCNSSYVFV